MTNTPTPEAIVKAALERAADCCKVGPSDEWSEETREGYLFSAGECWDNIQRLASDQAEVAQIIQNAGGKTDPYLYAVGYDVGFEDGFKEAQGRIKELEATLTWQPIETAPKDGTPVLVYDPIEGSVLQARYTVYGWGDPVYYEWDCDPSHWMPMPQPPLQN